MISSVKSSTVTRKEKKTSVTGKKKKVLRHLQRGCDCLRCTSWIFYCMCCMIPLILVIGFLVYWFIWLLFYGLGRTGRQTSLYSSTYNNVSSQIDILFEEQEAAASHSLLGQADAIKRSSKDVGTQRFYYPSTVNPHLLHNATNPCTNLYEHACGNWLSTRNRLFDSTMRENKQDLQDIDHLIMGGAAQASAYVNVISPQQEQLFRVVQQQNGTFYNDADMRRLMELDDGRDRMVFNLNMNSFYRSCVNFYNSEDKKKSQQQQLHGKISEAFAEMQQHISQGHLASLWGSLEKHGARSPVDLALMEVPHRFEGQRRLLLHFEENGVFYDVMDKDRFLLRCKQHGIQVKDLLASVGIAEEREWLAIAFKVQIALARMHTNFTTSSQHHHGSKSASRMRSWRDAMQDYRDYYRISSYGAFKRAMFALSVGKLDLDAYVRSSGHPLIRDDETISVMSAAYFERLAEWLRSTNAGAPSRQEWSQYALYSLVRSYIDKMMPGSLIDDDNNTEIKKRRIEQSCLEHTKHLFPTSYCHSFRTSLPGFHERQKKAREIATGILSVIRSSEFIEKIIGTGFGICADERQSRQELDALAQHMGTLELSVGECFLSDRSRQVSHSSQLHRNALITAEMTVPIKDNDYLGNIWSIHQDATVRLHRHGFTERARIKRIQGIAAQQHQDLDDDEDDNDDIDENDNSKDEELDAPHRVSLEEPLHRTFSEVNAWYDSVYHRIVIPPGILRPAIFSELYDDTSLIATFGFALAHELGHASEPPLFNGASLSSEHMCSVRIYRKLSAIYQQKLAQSAGFMVASRDNSYGSRAFYENRADWFGIHAAYMLWKQKQQQQTTASISREFLLSLGQLWCAGPSSYQIPDTGDVHGISTHRVDVPTDHLMQFYAEMSKSFGKQFGCTKK